MAAAVVGLLEGGLPALRAKALLAGALMARTNARPFLLACKSKLLVQVQLGPIENQTLLLSQWQLLQGPAGACQEHRCLCGP